MTSYRICLALMVSLSGAWLIGQETPPSGTPTTLRELALMRSFHDKTTWADEVKSQQYEQTMYLLADALIAAEDPWSVLEDWPIRSLVLPSSSQQATLEYDIARTVFDGAPQKLDQAAWIRWLRALRKDGYRLDGSEWKHVAFSPPGLGPAKSTISVTLFVNQPVSQPVNQPAGSLLRRMIVKAQLEINWADETRDEEKRSIAELVQVSKLEILQREKAPAFSVAMDLPSSVSRSGKPHPTTIQPILVQDLDGDHFPEVILAGANQVFSNGGKWRFAKRELCAHPSRLITAAVLADFSGDGIHDLLCGVQIGFPRIYYGAQDGTFPDPPTEIRFSDVRQRRPSAITAGDIDRDGDVDVFIGQLRDGHLSGDVPTPYFDAKDGYPAVLLRNDGRGKFSDVTDVSGLQEKRNRRVRSASLVDFDGDRDLDLLLTSDFGGNDIFVNDGKGHFTDVTESLRPNGFSLGMAHVLGDFNEDGRIDFLTLGTHSSTTQRLDSMQLGRTDFPEYNAMRSAMGFGNRLYLNTSQAADAMTFQQATTSEQWSNTGWPSAGVGLDFDRDGDRDVFVTNGHLSGKSTRDFDARHWCHDIYFDAADRPNLVIRNFAMRMKQLVGPLLSWHGYEHNALLADLGPAGVADVGYLMGVSAIEDSRSAVSADLDLDGRVDLIYEYLLPENDAEVMLRFLKNESIDENHWVGVHLAKAGVPSKSLYGTVVTVHLSEGRRLVQHYVSGQSLGSQQSDSLHFGLGANRSVQKIEIAWGDGNVTVLTTPKVDQYHLATQHE